MGRAIAKTPSVIAKRFIFISFPSSARAMLGGAIGVKPLINLRRKVITASKTRQGAQETGHLSNRRASLIIRCNKCFCRPVDAELLQVLYNWSLTFNLRGIRVANQASLAFIYRGSRSLSRSICIGARAALFGQGAQLRGINKASSGARSGYGEGRRGS
jgi:hypothetical protein